MTRGKFWFTMLFAGLLGIGFAVYKAQRSDEKPEFQPPASQGRDNEIRSLDQLPAFRLPDLDGQSVTVDRWAGKVLVLNFWATWCPPCLRELPLFDELQRRHADAGLQVVGIAIDDKEAVERFLAEHAVSFPILLGDTEAIALSQRLGNRRQGLPFTVIFDAGGKRVYAHTGEVTRSALIEHLEPLLDRTGGT